MTNVTNKNITIKHITKSNGALDIPNNKYKIHSPNTPSGSDKSFYTALQTVSCQMLLGQTYVTRTNVTRTNVTETNANIQNTLDHLDLLDLGYMQKFSFLGHQEVIKKDGLRVGGSILQAGTCQILSLAENPRCSRSGINNSISCLDNSVSCSENQF